MAFNPKKHEFVPSHKKISEKEKKDLFEKYNVGLKELPVILVTDPALEGMSVAIGDIIKIERPSFTANKTIFYRRVGHE